MKEGGGSNIALYHWSVYFHISSVCGSNTSFSILITVAHHDRSVRERDIALVEEGGLSASAAGGRYGVLGSTARSWLQKYRTAGQVGNRRGTGLWSVSSPAQDAALVAEAQWKPSANARELKAATNFPGQKSTVISRLKAGISMTCCGEGCTYR
jgi:transposase-like protein